jgi:hypothetical protein
MITLGQPAIEKFSLETLYVNEHFCGVTRTLVQEAGLQTQFMITTYVHYIVPFM